MGSADNAGGQGRRRATSSPLHQSPRPAGPRTCPTSRELTVRETYGSATPPVADVGPIPLPGPTGRPGRPAYLVLSLPRPDNTHVGQRRSGSAPGPAPPRRRPGAVRVRTEIARAQGRKVLMGDYVTPCPAGRPRYRPRRRSPRRWARPRRCRRYGGASTWTQWTKTTWDELAAEAQATAPGTRLALGRRGAGRRRRRGGSARGPDGDRRPDGRPAIRAGEVRHRTDPRHRGVLRTPRAPALSRRRCATTRPAGSPPGP